MAAAQRSVPILLEEDWTTFTKLGRPDCKDHNVIWCEAYFNSPNVFVFRAVGRSHHENHAEHKALGRLVGEEKKRRKQVSAVKLFSCHQPCIKCGVEMVDFLQARHEVSIELVLTALEFPVLPVQRETLESLDMCAPWIKIRTITSADWQHLARRRRVQKESESKHGEQPKSEEGQQSEYEQGQESESEKGQESEQDATLSRTLWDEIFDQQLSATLDVQYGMADPKLRLFKHQQEAEWSHREKLERATK